MTRPARAVRGSRRSCPRRSRPAVGSGERLLNGRTASRGRCAVEGFPRSPGITREPSRNGGSADEDDRRERDEIRRAAAAGVRRRQAA